MRASSRRAHHSTVSGPVDSGSEKRPWSTNPACSSTARPIEIFDGYSEAYGASAGDLIANATGSLFFLAQQKVWGEQRLIPRFSFRRTGYPSLRPDVLGDTRVSEILKDYNGQTYWVSIDADKFIKAGACTECFFTLTAQHNYSDLFIIAKLFHFSGKVLQLCTGH